MSYWEYILRTLRPHRKRLIVSLVAMLGIMVIDLGSPLVVAVLIDTIVAKKRYDLLPPLMLVFLALPFGAALFKSISSYAVTVLGQRVVFDVRLELYRRVHRLSCRYLQSTTIGKLMERLRGDVQQLQILLTSQTPQILVQVASGLIMTVIMFVLSVKLTLLILLGVFL